MVELKDFRYSNRDLRVVFGSGSLARLGVELDAILGRARCLVLSSPGRATLVEEATAILGDRVVATFTGAEIHVPAATVIVALERVVDATPDCIVSAGGGSAIGLGKALAARTGLPLVAVPTTYSGSEMTDIWGVTDGDRKATGRDRRVAPRLVVYDPDLTHSMPPSVTGPSGMNAIAHAVEALYAKDTNPTVGLFASDGIRRLVRSLPVCVADPADSAARADALCGAHFCGRALDLTTMGLHHKLCHVLGGSFGLPHALTHAVMLPHVVAFNASAASEQLSEVTVNLGSTDAASGLWDLNHSLGISQNLGDLGIRASDIDSIIREVEDKPYSNPAPVTAEGLRNLITHAIEGARPEGAE